MPKSYAYLCEQEADDASEHSAEYGLPCFSGSSLLRLLPCDELCQAVVDVFELAVNAGIALYLLALPIVEIVMELL